MNYDEVNKLIELFYGEDFAAGWWKRPRVYWGSLSAQQLWDMGMTATVIAQARFVADYAIREKL